MGVFLGGAEEARAVPVVRSANAVAFGVYFYVFGGAVFESFRAGGVGVWGVSVVVCVQFLFLSVWLLSARVRACV